MTGRYTVKNAFFNVRGKLKYWVYYNKEKEIIQLV